jgi:hypothetical protein
MSQRRAAPDDASAARWLRAHANTLFATVRCVVPDSLCAYDLGFELSALIARGWDELEAHPNETRMGWAIRLADELIARAAARGVVPTLERHRSGEPLMLTLSSADLHDLSELASAPWDLDEDAGAALAAMRRRVPTPAALSSLEPSHLVRRASSEVAKEGC